MILILTASIVAAVALAYLRANGIAWTVLAAVALYAGAEQLAVSPSTAGVLSAALVVVAALLTVRPLRRRAISDPLLALYRRILPAMSQTEQEAIDAGTVWWDGELFSGRPDWAKLIAFPGPKLSSEELSFLDNECEQLCSMVSDWETTQVWQDLPPHVWQFIKEKGFLGMIIPKKYGGREFSAYAHSQVVMKLSTHCSAASVSVMVPNSLGPAELLLHYGTEEQKERILPGLARGTEIPAFALTNPHAGSDAASIPDTGIVCRGVWEGREIIGMRVTWEKRYITLGPVCTVLGLAFRLLDPDHLLEGTETGKEDLGITCALVRTSTPGVNIGRRHFPLNAVFQNGPVWGKDVFMPIDWIIGGPKMAGHGWRMLMESLAAGRSISLPSTSCGYTKLAVRATGAYARVRNQFKMPIGKFEGVEEALTRMGANLYMMDAARILTVSAVDMGEKPSVVSALAKYHLTERARKVVNDAMDVLGGKGICLGPNNFMGRAYQQLPIAITVEGANILTRSLIIFGQGAIRCHPYVLAEINAAREPDRDKASRDFDAALFGHLKFALSNAARAFVMGITGSQWVRVPGVAPQTRRHFQKLTRFSAAFAFLADVSMLVLGGGLKRREKLSARLGDVLSIMYLCSAALKRYEDQGRQQADLPLLEWSVWDAMFQAQNAIEGVIANYPSRIVAWFLARVIFPLGRPYVVPSDRLGHKVAALLIAPSPARDRLTAGMHLPKIESGPIGMLEAALDAAILAEPIEQKIRAAHRAGTIAAGDPGALAAGALAAGIIDPGELATLERAGRLRDEVIRVDDFPADFGASASLRQAQGPAG